LTILKTNGVERRKTGAWSRKYRCNESFFESIDSQEKAYWLGFIAADGYIQRGRDLVLNVCVKDSAHLEKLKKDLGSTHEVRTYFPPSNSYGFSQLRIYSPKMSFDLRGLGIGERKNKTLRWPLLRPALMKHFFRGYFDGDGSIFISYRGKQHNRFGLCIISNPMFLLGCRNWLLSSCKITKTRIRGAGTSKIAKEIRYGKQSDVQRIVRCMYLGSYVYLERKREFSLPLLNGGMVFDRRRK